MNAIKCTLLLGAHLLPVWINAHPLNNEYNVLHYLCRELVLCAPVVSLVYMYSKTLQSINVGTVIEAELDANGINGLMKSLTSFLPCEIPYL